MLNSEEQTQEEVEKVGGSEGLTREVEKEGQYIKDPKTWEDVAS